MNTKQTDLDYVWHPYTDIDTFEKSDFPIVTKAKGCWLYDSNGNKYLDALSSWWCVNLGHGNKKIVKAIATQAKTMQHVMLGGMSHEPIIKLAEELIKTSGMKLKKCFFASDGSSAVEAALRIAIQYWRNQGNTKKIKFISLNDGYHGDTIGCVSLGYVETFHKDIRYYLPNNFKATSPHCAKCPFGKHPESCKTECFSSMDNLVKKHHEEVCAVIVEPLCQGAAGMRIYPAEYLQKLEKLCKQHKILLICDEIAVGFYRTGTMFASNLAGISPDIITIGKGLTGGYIPMSAAITTEEVFDSFRGGRTLFYGHTFSGNPLAASAAMAALQVYKEKCTKKKMEPLIKMMTSFAKDMQSLLQQSFTQSLGMIVATEISEADGGYDRVHKIVNLVKESGVLIRPIHNTIYIWPPLLISKKELKRIFSTIKNAAQKTAPKSQ